MARRRLRQPSRRVPTSLLLLVGLAFAVAVAFAIASAAGGGQEDGADLRISVTYPTEEESQWLDRWAEKYRGKPGSGFSIEPATAEESAYLNNIFAHGKGGARAGYDGRIEFDANDRPRIVVDKVHSGPRSSEPNVDLQNKEDSHAEQDLMEL
ncbi:unnamed protein product [Urochloa humidicola]